MRPVLNFLYARIMRRVDKVIIYNSDDRREMIGRGLCRPEQCVMIPGSGVDTVRFTPVERSSEGPVVVTLVARLIRDKGVEEFLTAAETLKRRWGDKVEFRLVGDADPGNPWGVDRDWLNSCRDRGIVRLDGFIEDIAAVLKESDIFAFPSYREGLPVAVLEAMSAGLAVVTTDAVGCRETVVDEQSGLIVPYRDAGALADALGRLIEDSGLRRRFGVEARRRAVDRFSIEKIVGAHMAVYKSLLGWS